MPVYRSLLRPALLRSACLFAALVAASAAFASAPNPSDAPLRASQTSQPARAPAGEQQALTLARELAFASSGMYFGLSAILVPWGQTATIPTSEATSKSNGLCTFRHQFYVRNLGLLSSISTQNRVRVNSPVGPLGSSVTMGSIPYATVFNNSADIVLAPGTYTLYAKIDEPNTNAEYYENNNLKSMQVIISGSCS